MDDSPFSQIVEQAINELKQYTRKLKKNPIAVYPRAFEGQILRLIRADVFSSLFSKICDVESLDASNDGDVDIVCFVPNNPDYMKIVLDKFSGFRECGRHILIMPRLGPRCKTLFEMSGIGDKVHISDFHADILLLEK